jgi:hypothetical protein
MPLEMHVMHGRLEGMLLVDQSNYDRSWHELSPFLPFLLGTIPLYMSQTHLLAMIPKPG